LITASIGMQTIPERAYSREGNWRPTTVAEC